MNKYALDCPAGDLIPHKIHANIEPSKVLQSLAGESESESERAHFSILYSRGAAQQQKHSPKEPSHTPHARLRQMKM